MDLDALSHHNTVQLRAWGLDLLKQRSRPYCLIGVPAEEGDDRLTLLLPADVSVEDTVLMLRQALELLGGEA